MPEKRDITKDTIHRVFHLLKIISTYRGNWFHLTDCATRAELARSTCHRYLNAFVEEGVLEKNERVQGTYRHKTI